MSQPTHPLMRYIRIRAAENDQNVEQALVAFARALTADGVRIQGGPVKARTVRAWAEGKRHPKPPVSGAVARRTGIDELLLLTWGRGTVDHPEPASGEAA